MIRKEEAMSEKNAVLEKELPQGLTSDEAAQLKKDGFANITKEKSGKSYLGIALENLLTFFNLVWAVIAVLMIILQSFSNLTFLAVIIPNVMIAIIQEWRAKKTVEKLSVTTDPRATVVRDGALCEIPSCDLVVGDVTRIEMGQQILADGVVLSGLAEANESLLTGESNAIKKEEGSRVLAGSFLVSGGIFVKVTEVGKNTYIHKIEKAAKSFKPPSSDLFRDLNRLLRYIAYLMIPLAVVLYFSNLSATGGDSHQALLQTSGSVIGMIPAGMYLLVTVTLTLSVITLATKKTLVQDMYSIEMLARADVLCLDKTGTITDGTMCVSDLIALSDKSEEELRVVLAAIEGAEQSLNATSRALIEAFGSECPYEILDRIPFSSSRKYSAISLLGLGCFSLGAPHFVNCPVSEELEGKIEELAKEGKRVLLLACHEELSSVGSPLALVAVTDRIRPNAKETIAKFQEQGVAVKIISGDHAATVSSIAGRVGVLGYESFISCESLSDEELEAAAEGHTVFGRVSPEQKVLLVKKLRSLGHTVAMTGDGINDTLALKESNCAIAMADGSEVARKISQIVLLESDFGTLPDVVREGRRCINNVRQSASLFLMKTLLTICLSLYTAVTVSLYPFQPKGTVLLELFVIGLASVLLALEPNNNRIKGSFIKSVIFSSIPSAIGLLIPLLTLSICNKSGLFAANEIYFALSILGITAAGFVNLLFLCIPYTRWRTAVVSLAGAGIALTVPLSIYLLGDMFGLTALRGNVPLALLVSGCAAVCAAIVQLVTRLILQKIRKKA